MNKSKHFEEVNKFALEHNLEVKLFNGVWCVYDSNLEYPFNFIEVEEFYNKYLN